MKRIRIALVGALCAAGILGNSAALAADNAIITVSATVVGTCKVTSGGSLDFGNIDPSGSGAVAGTPTQPAFWCTKGAIYAVMDSSPNKSGATFRMKHALLGEYIPYTFTYTSSGTGNGKTGTALEMNVAGSVAESDYINASAGGYTDTVTLSITP